MNLNERQNKRWCVSSSQALKLVAIAVVGLTAVFVLLVTKQSGLIVTNPTTTNNNNIRTLSLRHSTYRELDSLGGILPDRTFTRDKAQADSTNPFDRDNDKGSGAIVGGATHGDNVGVDDRKPNLLNTTTGPFEPVVVATSTSPSSSPSSFVDSSSLVEEKSSEDESEEEEVLVEEESTIKCPVDRKFVTPRVYLKPRDDDDGSFNNSTFPGLNEISSLAISKQRLLDEPSHLLAWVISDGAQHGLSLVNLQTGTTIAYLYLETILISEEYDDWETISLGPCGSDSSTSTSENDVDCLYIGNTGNNDAKKCETQDCTLGRDTLYVYKLKEPNLQHINTTTTTAPTILSSGPTVTIPINFNSSDFPVNRYNIESMFVDWTGSSNNDEDRPGDIYLIPEQVDKNYVRMAKIPVHVHESNTLENVVVAPFTPQALRRPSWDDSLSKTEADMSRDGKLIMLRTVFEIRYYKRLSKIDTVVDALTLSKNECRYVSHSSFVLQENQVRYESVGFVPSYDNDDQKMTVVEISECTKQSKQCLVPINQFDIFFLEEDSNSTTTTDVAETLDGTLEEEGFDYYNLTQQLKQWYVITYDDFEYGLGNFRSAFINTGNNDESDDVKRHIDGGLFTSSGVSSYRIRDNEGYKSSFVHNTNHNVTKFTILNITFTFVLDGYDSNENFFVEYTSDGGTTYSIIGEYVTQPKRGQQLPNAYEPNQRYTETILLTKNDVYFTSQVRLRFRSNSSNNRDKVYIDDIWFMGYGPSSSSSSINYQRASSLNGVTQFYGNNITYDPGNLDEEESIEGTGLRLSRGLKGRIIATSGSFVTNYNGDEVSDIPFHEQPTKGDIFELGNEGYVYVSNSYKKNAGGVGAIYFDNDGNVLHYSNVLLTNTTRNNGATKTPWNTWLTCEENDSKKIFEVNPFGEIMDSSTSAWMVDNNKLLMNDTSSSTIIIPEQKAYDSNLTTNYDNYYGENYDYFTNSYGYGILTCLGISNNSNNDDDDDDSEISGITFDGRKLKSKSCATNVEDCHIDLFTSYGTLIQRYQPIETIVQYAYNYETGFASILSNCDLNNTIEYINILSKNNDDVEGGIFEWTTNINDAKKSTKEYLSDVGDIQVNDGALYVVSPKKKSLFIFDLDSLSYKRYKTNKQGNTFNHRPYQIKFIYDDIDNDDNTGSSSLSSTRRGLNSNDLYMTETDGPRCGVHIRRERDGFFLTLLESIGSDTIYDGSDTSGLAFSPDKTKMYVTFVKTGHLWEFTRQDGYTFDYETIVDVRNTYYQSRDHSL